MATQDFGITKQTLEHLIIDEYPNADVLYTHDSEEGYAAAVYEVKGHRYYYASCGEYGFRTNEPGEMGEQWRGLWGEYEREVYGE